MRTLVKPLAGTLRQTNLGGTAVAKKEAGGGGDRVVKNNTAARMTSKRARELGPVLLTQQDGHRGNKLCVEETLRDRAVMRDGLKGDTVTNKTAGRKGGGAFCKGRKEDLVWKRVLQGAFQKKKKKKKNGFGRGESCYNQLETMGRGRGKAATTTRGSSPMEGGPELEGVVNASSGKALTNKGRVGFEKGGGG